MWREEENTVEGLVFVDSQAALKALQSNTPVSGHQIADAIHSAYERVMAKHPRAKITFRWVATYKECEGNEIADKQAKLASSGDQDSPAEDLPELLRSRLGCSESAMEIGVMKGPKKRATAVLQSSKQREKLEEIDSSMPSTKFRKVQVGMSRGQAALYIQLCIGHVPLGCNTAHEAVKHYLLDCPANARMPAIMWAKVGREARSIRTHHLTRKRSDR